MPQLAAVDISAWQDDEVFGRAYPEGARPKRAVCSPESVASSELKPSWRYLFKLSDKRYREQFWAEVIAHEISNQIKIPTPPAFAAYDTTTGQCGALIEWFYLDGQDIHVHAGDLFQRHIPGFDRKKGTQHNLNDALRFARVVKDSPYIKFIEMLMFDTLIGNTDRHQDNWGFLVNVQAVSNQDPLQANVRFTPWFDNGTSLGCELDTTRITSWRDEDYARYMNRAKHHLRPKRDQNLRIGQIKYMEILGREFINNSPEQAKSIFDKINSLDLDLLRKSLEEMTRLNMPENGKLSPQRAELIYSLTCRRHAMLKDFFDEHA